jgi:peptidoglycan/LPS O-acetylase OafA/YrhL
MDPPTSSHAERYPILDGIRGTAILMVSASHFSNLHDGPFSGAGQFGVWLFFVLSAFLLSLYFFHRPERIASPLEWTNYTVRRVLRIYPLYVLVLIVGVILGHWSIADVLHAMLLQEPTYWPVFVECRWYAVLPIVVMAMEFGGRVNRLIPAFLVLCSLGFFYFIIPRENIMAGYEWPRGYTWLFAEFVPSFMFGTLAAWCFSSLRKFRPVVARSIALDLALAVAFLIPWIMCAPVLNFIFGTSLEPDYFHTEFVPWSACFAVYIVAAMMSDGLTARCLRSRPLVFMGYVSYSTYLFQDYWFVYLPKLIPDAAPLVFVTGCAVLATSYLLFISVERPLSRVSLLRSPVFTKVYGAAPPPRSTMNFRRLMGLPLRP